MNKPEIQVVLKVHQCPECGEKDKVAIFSRAPNLRKHLTIHDKRYVFEAKPGNQGKPADNITFIEKEDCENHESYKTWFMCPGCSKHYVSLDNLGYHIKNNHFNKASASDILLEVNIREPSAEITPATVKRMRTTKEINQTIFKCGTDAEAGLANHMMSTFNTASTVLKIKSNDNADIVSVVSSKHDLSTLSFYHKQTVELEVEPAQDQVKSNDNVASQVTSNHVNTFLESSRFAWLMKNQEYTEIDESCLEIINYDWSLRPYYRVASGQLLSSAILVERDQILLINGIELYSRDATADPHHERFGSKFMIASNPTLFNRYEYQVNILSKIEDQSSKLIIGTNVFNALVISSKRLDTDSKPEVGPSTYSFTPSSNTRLYISSKMMLAANKTIENHAETAQCSDFLAQLRQIRSSLTNPLTYTFSRYFSEWMDQLLYRPYTIFTVKGKSNKKQLADFIVASKVLSEVAMSMIFNKAILRKSRLENIDIGNADTVVKKAVEAIYKLYGDKDELKLVGNDDLEAIAMELSGIVTNNLKKENEYIVYSIEDLMNRYANINIKKL